MDEKNIDLATNNFLNAMNSVLNIYTPRKKANNYKLKLTLKYFITSGIQKSSSIKYNLLKKIINKKNPQRLNLIKNMKETETSPLH